MHEIHFQGHTSQRRFWAASSRFRCFCGGVGSGKSHAGIVALLLDQGPRGSNALIIAPTYPILRDSTVRSFLEIIPRPLLKSFNRAELRAELANGATLLFRSSDRPDRLRGCNVGLVYIDEAAYCDRSTWDVAIGRLREEPGRAWITTTPRGRSNWVYRVFVEESTPDHTLIHCATTDNLYLPPTFVDSLRSSYSSGFYRQEIEGLFIEPEASILKRQWLQFIDAPPDRLRWVRYWDLAFSQKQTADYTASIRAAMGPDGRIYFRDGIHGRYNWPQAKRVITEVALREPGTLQGIEVVGNMIGAYQDLLTVPELANVELKPIHPRGDKMARAQPLAARAEQSRVCIIRGTVPRTMIDELVLFPEASHDDAVDAFSGALSMIAKGAGEVLISRGRPISRRIDQW